MGQRPVVLPRGAPQGQDTGCKVPTGLQGAYRAARGSSFMEQDGSQQPWTGQMKRWRLLAPSPAGPPAAIPVAGGEG